MVVKKREKLIFAVPQEDFQRVWKLVKKEARAFDEKMSDDGFAHLVFQINDRLEIIVADFDNPNGNTKMEKKWSS